MTTAPRSAWRARDVLASTVIGALVVFGLVGLWHASAILMFAFLGILFGLALTAGVDRLARYRVPRALGALLLLLLVAGVLAGLGAMIAPTLTDQLSEIRTRLPQAATKIEAGFNARLRGEFGAWTGLGGGAARQPKARPAPSPSSKAPATPSPASRAPAAQAPAAQAPTAQAPSATTPTTASPSATPAGQDSAQARGDSTRGRDAGDSAHAPPSGSASHARPTPGTGVSGATAFGSAPAGSGASGSSPSGALNFQSQLSSGLATVAQHALGVIGSTVELIIYLLLVVFLAVYIAVEPELYYAGVLHLIPHGARPRAREVLTSMASVMRRWLLTQVIAMVTIGVIWGVALAILHVKAALALAVIAALLEFVPTIGPTIAAVPAIAVGILDSPQKGLEVIALYLLVQGIESNILIPVLMKGQIDLPPGLTIVWQALMALAFGFLGLLVAVPLLAAIVVAVKMLYVRDVVGDTVDLGRAVERSGEPSG
jgi:predicted PurR-regulated permease PerM